jgi:hypothetical protein
MKRILILSLAAGLLSVGTQALMAQASTNTPALTQPQKPGAQERQQERRRLLKTLGLTSKELKGLAPADRRAKIKETADQKVSQLQQQKADGSITAEGQSDLAFLQHYLQHTKVKPAADN